ncbi:hypothetical protein FT663_03876 [Candidozyma haemuli var. vulneris]|uniref:Pre-rRNA-processing protein TSR2 n=1 Tax=Candidozyma haemuli TaxID=45357 RepID=A0A2V1ANK6_9ASCO|nr:hypothetical protein CXQ85_001590 [[Candida] haemuloni]KAF3988837.1 hypothetical protein FT663_03876 [[Candida] haemuloni var. vulneris]PVH19284.1 hypothetical protein CXQ85_001590 [[Candida] haemuloni]
MSMYAIDPTDFVRAEDDRDSLRFDDPQQQGKFELGVCMAVYKWDELNTAVENSWGGPNSAEKRDWLSGVVIDLFEEKAVDNILIEETLLFAMVDEFDTEIDNDSALEIAALILRLYKECSAKKFSSVDDLYEKYQKKASNASKKQNIKIETDPNNPSSDEEDGENEDEVPQLVERIEDTHIEEAPKGPVVDDDGFELVQKKGRRR